MLKHTSSRGELRTNFFEDGTQSDLEELRDDLTALNLSNASNMDRSLLGKNID